MDTERSLDYQDQTWRQSICGGVSLAPTIDDSVAGDWMLSSAANTPTPSATGASRASTRRNNDAAANDHTLDYLLAGGSPFASQQQKRRAQQAAVAADESTITRQSTAVGAPLSRANANQNLLHNSQQQQQQAPILTNFGNKLASLFSRAPRQQQQQHQEMVGETRQRWPAASGALSAQNTKDISQRVSNNNNSGDKMHRAISDRDAAELDRLLAEMSESLDLSTLARHQPQQRAHSTMRAVPTNAPIVAGAVTNKSATLAPARQQQNGSYVQQRSQAQSERNARAKSKSMSRLAGEHSDATTSSILDELDGASRMLAAMIGDAESASSKSLTRRESSNGARTQPVSRRSSNASRSTTISGATHRSAIPIRAAPAGPKRASVASSGQSPKPATKATPDDDNGDEERSHATTVTTVTTARKLSTASSSTAATTTTTTAAAAAAAPLGRDKRASTERNKLAASLASLQVSKQPQRRPSSPVVGAAPKAPGRLRKRSPPTPPAVDYPPACVAELTQPHQIELHAAAAAASEDEPDDDDDDDLMRRIGRRTLSGMRSMRNKLSDLVSGSTSSNNNNAPDLSPQRSQSPQTPAGQSRRSRSRGRRDEDERQQALSDDASATFGQRMRRRLSRSKSRLGKLLTRGKSRERARSQPSARKSPDEHMFEPGDISRNSARGDDDDDVKSPLADSRALMSPTPRVDSAPDSFNDSLDRHIAADLARRAEQQAKADAAAAACGGSTSASSSSELSGIERTSPAHKRTQSVSSAIRRRLSASLPRAKSAAVSPPSVESTAQQATEDLDEMKVSVSRVKRKRVRRSRSSRSSRHSATTAESGRNSDTDNSGARDERPAPRRSHSRASAASRYFDQRADEQAPVPPPAPPSPRLGAKLARSHSLRRSPAIEAKNRAEEQHLMLQRQQQQQQQRAKSTTQLAAAAPQLRAPLPSAANSFRPVSACADARAMSDDMHKVAHEFATELAARVQVVEQQRVAAIGVAPISLRHAAQDAARTLPDYHFRPMPRPDEASRAAPLRPPRTKNKNKKKETMMDEQRVEDCHVIDAQAASPASTLESGVSLEPERRQSRGRLSSLAHHIKSSATDFFKTTPPQNGGAPSKLPRPIKQQQQDKIQSTTRSEWRPVIESTRARSASSGASAAAATAAIARRLGCKGKQQQQQAPQSMHSLSRSNRLYRSCRRLAAKSRALVFGE